MQGLLVDADYVLYMLYKKPWAPGARGASAKLAVCGPYAKNLLPSAPDAFGGINDLAGRRHLQSV